MIDEYEAFDRIRTGGGSEVLGGNLPQSRYDHHTYYMT
jgi:hypothetical protein